MEDNILSQAKKGNRPEPNIYGDFECQSCGSFVGQGHYDGTAQILRWWCENDHMSVIEEMRL